jgi:hypothetical protein
MSLAIYKKYDLSGIAEGWTDECSLIYKGTKFSELKAFQAATDSVKDADQRVQKIIDFIVSHFVSAKGLTESADGTPVVADITASDIADLPLEVITDIFHEMMGQAPDPKGSTPTVNS